MLSNYVILFHLQEPHANDDLYYIFYEEGKENDVPHHAPQPLQGGLVKMIIFSENSGNWSFKLKM